MSLSVEGKSAIVTGAGSGISLAFARLLLSKGCSVLIADLKLRPEAEDLLNEYPEGKKPAAIFHKTDVTFWPQLTTLWSKALSIFGTIDIVAAGAGVFEPREMSFWEVPTANDIPKLAEANAEPAPGHFSVLDVNLAAPIRLSQMAVGYWVREKKQGCLVHIGSFTGYLKGINTPLYFASKHGLHGFVRSLGGLKDHLGVRIGAVAPRATRTPMWSDDPDKGPMINEQTEVLEPEEVAEAMYDIVTNPELGDGTIYEVTKGAKRVVLEFDTVPPSGRVSGVPGYDQEAEAIFAKLKKGEATI